jgi:hypothetical protein
VDAAATHTVPVRGVARRRPRATIVRSGSYHRRDPEATLLYRLVAEELDGLDHDLAAASPYGRGLPRHVAKELRAYLDCGQLRRGFARVVCRRCRAEHLVAFSCHGRAICPSCTARRMSDTAAHLVDRVIPRVPVRQWVVTFAPRVRYHLAADPKLAAAALTQVLRVVFAFHRRRARWLGARPARAHSTGAISMVQRFNSALALSLHFHILAADGVFLSPWYEPDARPTFVELPAPTDDELAGLLDQIIRRVTRLLRRHGRLDDDGDAEPEQLVRFGVRSSAARRWPAADEELPPLCARREGFSLHAGRAVHANDREGLERLAAYALRPPLAQGRLSLIADGQVLYRMKRTFSDGTSTISFTPRDFVARLCALVPPPRFHVVRYAGLFAAHARGRYALTGRGLHDAPCTGDSAATRRAAAPMAATSTAVATTAPASLAPSPRPTESPAPAAARSSNSTFPQRGEAAAGADDEIAGPDDPGRARRLQWADLLQRVWHEDVLICSRCGGELRLVAVVTDRAVIEKILRHLRLWDRGPPAVRHVVPDPDVPAFR